MTLPGEPQRGDFKRLLQINDSLARGGTETSIQEAANWLVAQGISIDIGVLHGPIELSGDGANSFTSHITEIDRHPREGLLACRKAMRKLLKSVYPDIVHVHSFFGLLAVCLAFPGRRPFRLIASLHNLGYDAWPARTTYELLRKQIHGVMLRRADAVTAITQAVADHYSQHLGITTDVVIPDPLPRLAEELGVQRKASVRGDGSPLLLALPGRITREKGHAVALIGVRILLDRGHSVVLRILGGGPLEGQVREQIEALELHAYVEVSGSLGHRALLEGIAGADLCIIPSLQEGLGIVALEAMALGVPLVASRTGGLGEVITDGQTGLLFAPGDAEELAARIINVATNPEASRQRAAAAASHVRHRFSSQTIGEQWLSLYQKVLAA